MSRSACWRLLTGNSLALRYSAPVELLAHIPKQPNPLPQRLLLIPNFSRFLRRQRPMRDDNQGQRLVKAPDDFP